MVSSHVSVRQGFVLWVKSCRSFILIGWVINRPVAHKSTQDVITHTDSRVTWGWFASKLVRHIQVTTHESKLVITFYVQWKYIPMWLFRYIFYISTEKYAHSDLDFFLPHFYVLFEKIAVTIFSVVIQKKCV